MTEGSLEERRRAAVERLQRGKEALLAAIGDVTAAEIFRGAQWSVADVLRHLDAVRPATARGGWLLALRRALEEDNPDLPRMGDPEAGWVSLRARVAQALDEVIAFAQGLTESQLARPARLGGKEVQAIDLLEGYAGHNLEHAAQIREEILPRVRRSG